MMFEQKYPHRIRLRGPWEFEPCELFPGIPPGRLNLPFVWKQSPLEHFPGKCLFRRRFGYPGRIDADERVWLSVDGVGAGAEISLNGNLLAVTDSLGEFEIGSVLSPRNILEITMAEDSSWMGIVALEIRKSAYLRNVFLQEEAGRFSVRGHLVGHADRPLELYCLVDGKQARYRQLAATPGGTAFDLSIPEELGVPREVKLELVNVSSIWYSVQLNASGDSE